MEKSDLRRSIREIKKQLTDKQIADASARLTERFLQTEAYLRCTTLFGYCAFNQEVRTEAILRHALAQGKTLALPRVQGKRMRFIRVDDLRLLQPGAMGIVEPPQDAPDAEDERALILMPGLAFDKAGHRIGYGGGYYDRYLHSHPNHTLIALCYDFQLFDALDTDDYDIPVHMILSEPV